MTEEERKKVMDIIVRTYAKKANSYAPIAIDDTEFTDRCKNFIATKTDEDLVSLLLGGSINVLSTDK